jgi:putative ATP-dependent endonuclease of the OLD family
VRLLAVLRIVRVATTDLCAGQNAVDTAQNTLTARDEIREVADTMSQRLEAMVGPAHTTSVALGLAPTQIDAPLRALRLLIDGGARGMADAGLGTANLAFLALKSLELDRLVADGDRDHTFLAVEELVHGRRSLKRHTSTPQVHIMC